MLLSRVDVDTLPLQYSCVAPVLVLLREFHLPVALERETDGNIIKQCTRIKINVYRPITHDAPSSGETSTFADIWTVRLIISGVIVRLEYCISL